MNSYQRLMNRLNGEKVDKVPNLCILMSFAARYSGIPYSEFCTVPEKMVEANIRCHEEFGIDIVTTMSDPYGETQDYGAIIEYPYDGNPICTKHFITSPEDVVKLKIRNIDETIRMKNRVKTIELYKKALKGKCAIAGWVEGALAELCDLRGINETMMDLALGEEYVDEVLEICTEQAIVYAKEQVKAGADIIGVGDAAVSLVGPELYRKYAIPYEKRIIDAIHECGGKVKLHICGNISAILNDIKSLGADIVDIDWMVDFNAANEILHGASSANGNLSPVDVLLNGNPELINKSVKSCLDVSNKFSIISGGCEIPRNTPYENLMAVKQALKSLGV